MNQPPLFKAKLILPAIPFILAVLALAGWIWGIDSLKRGMTSSVAMNPAAAVCMILLAFEAIRLNVNNDQTVLYKAGQLAIFLVIAASAMKLSDLLFGSSFSIDQLLFSSKLNAESDQPNRMAPNTAICFFILGWAMQFMRGQADSLVFKAQLMATGTMLLALLALVGHLFGAQELSGIAHYTPMAVNAAFAFVFISLSVLLAHHKKRFYAHFFRQ